jgi:glycine/D-amino acid oxidase-like deaminating enzyme
MGHEAWHARVGVVGGGVVDVNTAWELAADNHEATGFERIAAA